MEVSINSKRTIQGPVWLIVAFLVTWVGFLACEPAAAPTEPGTQEAPKEFVAQERSEETEAPFEALGDGGSLEREPPKNYPLDDQLRVNHIQVKGTHNSYHLDPGQGVDEWRYEHKPLDVQLQTQGVRKFELDLYWEKDEGAYAVYHIPLVDAKTSCYRFTDCLKTIKGWSDQHRNHLPLFVMLEFKNLGGQPAQAAFAAAEKEILSVYPRERVLAPDDVKGSYQTLKEAVNQEGWPKLKDARGKVFFVVLTSQENRALYTNGNKDLDGKLMFVADSPDMPYTAVVFMDGPEGKEQEIQALVKKGYLVRTRADAGLKGKASRLEAALKSGAHVLSTDFPAPVDGSDYYVDIPGGTPARCNPVTAPAICTSAALE